MRSTIHRWLLSAALLAASTATAVPALAAGRGMLGVTTQSTDEDLRRGLDLTRDGLLVNQVFSDGPAQQAGLRKGDVILTYNSRAVTAPEELRQLVRDTEPGRSITLGIWRDGARRTLQVTLAEAPDSDDDSFNVPVPAMPRAPRAPRAPTAPRAPRAYDDDHSEHEHSGDVTRRIIINGKEVPEDEIDGKLEELGRKGIRIDHLNGVEGLEGLGDLKDLGKLKDLAKLKGMRDFEGLAPTPGGSTFFMPSAGRGRLGVRVEKLNDDLAQALGASGDQGVLVVQVLEDTPAQKAGIRAGDVIVRVGSDDVDSPEALVKALGDHDGAQVNLVILRKGTRREIQADLDSRSDDSVRERVRTGRPERIRIMEPGQGHQVYRWKTKDDAESGSDDSDLRAEMRQLKQELRELREQLRDKK